jgi:ABC-2 type transport system permease protein
MVSLLTFWEEAYWTLSMFSWALISFFGGSLLPLEFYPGFLRPLVDVLPFKYMSYSPVMIYMGRMSTMGSLLVFLNQIFFTLVFYLIARILFNVGRKKFTSQGG